MTDSIQVTLLAIWDYEGEDQSDERWDEFRAWLKTSPEFVYTKIHDTCEL